MATHARPASGLDYPFGERAPAPGELLPVADGIGWWRVPMSGPLKHVNGLILNDGAHVLAVDTGTASPRSTEAWRTLLAGPLAEHPVGRVLCTHFHPDHAGLAGWLHRKFAAPVLMTRGEWLTLRLLAADARPEVPDEVTASWRAAGWSEAQIASGLARGWSGFAKLIAPLPLGYHRIADGDTLTVGGTPWQVVVGSGHSPEHACLLDEDRRVLIAGDQVLPRISSNVSITTMEPDADPLGEWLASIAKLRRLSDDLLVLPGHGEPFRGLHARLDALAAEHADRLDALEDALADAPLRATDAFSLLFRRPIGDDMLGMATGEALAHLRRLEVTGRATRETRDGVWWYRRR